MSINENLSFPRQAVEVLCEPLDDGAVLVHPTTGLCHAVNPAGAFVWSCCDGQTSVGTIAAELAVLFPPGRDVQREVESFCADLQAQQLLADEDAQISHGTDA